MDCVLENLGVDNISEELVLDNTLAEAAEESNAVATVEDNISAPGMGTTVLDM